MLVGSSFQSVGAITEKALSPMREELERGEIRRGEEAERRRRLGYKSLIESNR